MSNFMFPILDMPGKNLIGPIHNLAAAFSREGGSLKEIWVSREIYDSLTSQILSFESMLEQKSPSEDKWSNGLIFIHTQFGKVKIRVD